MFTEQDYYQLPQLCPKYINTAFQVYQDDNLPQGVYEVEGIYYPVIFHGQYNAPRFEQPFNDSFFCHQHWQLYWVQSMKQALQYYNFSELYNEKMAKGIRVTIEKVQEDFDQGRETVF